MVFNWVRVAQLPAMSSRKLIVRRTPIINGLADAYAMFRFVRIRPWWEWKSFNDHVTLFEKKRRTSDTSLFVNN